MPWPVHPTGFFGARGDEDIYIVQRSLRFNSADSAYLTRTFSGTPYTYTLSWWVKRGALSSSQVMFGSRQGASNPSWIEFQADNTIKIVLGVNATVLTTTMVFRDTSAWYHFVLSVTPSSTSYLYVNGVQAGSWTSSGTPYLFNSLYTNAIGRYGDSATLYFDGYISEINFIDGEALLPSSFGETDPITGRWKVKKYGGSYGSNGFYLKFSDNSGTTDTTLGKDSSSNGNNWTPSGFSVASGSGNDSLVDSPTNYGFDNALGGNVRGNYCVLNQNDRNSAATISNGNLDVTATTTWRGVRGTMGMSYGKWYWEFLKNTVNTITGIGNSTNGHLNGFIGESFSGSYGYSYTGTKYTLGANNASYGSSYANGDIIGVAFDADSGTLEFFKNGTSQGTAYTSIPSDTYFPLVSLFSTGNSTFNFGQRPFAYTAPSGFKALCTQNLSKPTIQKPGKYMDALAYTGTGASNSISSLGFGPDLVWIKNRGTTTSHAIYDTTRGTQSQLSSDTTGDQVTSSSGLTSFDANGFTIGTSTLVNTSGTQYVAWSWDESVQAGLDIVSYTGNGANRTISHNLGVSPKMIIVKARTTAGTDQGWPVYHSSLGSTEYLLLNSTAAKATGADYWNSTRPTSSVFSLGTNASVNTNNDTYIAYVFSEVDGFSKFGSYTGNALADGTFVWCGFLPSFVLVKSSTAIDSWLIYDNKRSLVNVASTVLVPNTNAADATISGLDFVSGGFKLRTVTTTPNAAQTYIFAAFAESPFKYARAR